MNRRSISRAFTRAFTIATLITTIATLTACSDDKGPQHHAWLHPPEAPHVLMAPKNHHE